MRIALGLSGAFFLGMVTAAVLQLGGSTVPTLPLRTTWRNRLSRSTVSALSAGSSSVAWAPHNRIRRFYKGPGLG